MIGWIIALSVAIYLVGLWVTYRRTYRAAIDDLFKRRLNCSDCQENLKDYTRGYRESVTCWHHSWSNAAEGIWFPPLMMAMGWPLVGLVLGTKTAVVKTFFPRGVVTPAKKEWQLAVSAARIERNESEIQKQTKKINRSS